MPMPMPTCTCAPAHPVTVHIAHMVPRASASRLRLGCASLTWHAARACRAWQVLFWGMSLHWVNLLWEGLTQKGWLKAHGYKKPRKPAHGSEGSGDTDLHALV